MKRVVIGIFTGVVLLILFVVLCTFVRRPYERVLIDRFGNLIPEKDQSRIAYNWFFKLPTDTLVRIDTRLHVQTLTLTEMPTHGGQPVNVRTFVVWHITDPVAFRQKASGSDDVAEKIMEQRILGLLGQSIQTHSLDDFFNAQDPNTDQKIRAVETQIARDATNGVENGKDPGLKEMGIEIADIGFSRITFPPANTSAIYERMSAELNEKARNYEATGKRDADILLKDGLVKATKIRSDAVAEAGQIRGEGDREAAEIIAKVSNTPEAMEFYQYWKNLEVLKTALAKNTILVLSTDSPFLKNLFQALRNGPPGQGNPIGPPALTPMNLAPATQPAGSGGR